MKFLLGFRFSLQWKKSWLDELDRIIIESTLQVNLIKKNVTCGEIRTGKILEIQRSILSKDWRKVLNPVHCPEGFLLRDIDHILTSHGKFHLLRSGKIVLIYFKYKPILVESTDACCGGVSYDSALNLCCDGVLRRKNEASSACCGSDLRSKF